MLLYLQAEDNAVNQVSHSRTHIKPVVLFALAVSAATASSHTIAVLSATCYAALYLVETYENVAVQIGLLERDCCCERC